MNDIKVVQKKSVDYIPNDGILCGYCKFFYECPEDYVCHTLDRIQAEEKE